MNDGIYFHFKLYQNLFYFKNNHVALFTRFPINEKGIFCLVLG